MPRKFKSSNEEQDEAFFGSSSTSASASTSTSTRPPSSSVPINSSDEEFARTLQARYTKEAEESVLLCANSRSSNRNHQQQRDIEHQREIQEQQDLELALRLQRQGSLGAAQATGTNDDDDRRRRRKKQEEEDEKLAKAIQEAEGLSEPRGILPHDFQHFTPSDLQQQQQQRQQRPFPNRLSGIHDHHTINALIPRCAVCEKIVTFPIYALGNLYHKECFQCMGCQKVIKANKPFAVKTYDDGSSHPFHKSCYAEMYGMKCTICNSIIQGDSNGRVAYIKHPFFEEVACATHSQQRRCNGCHRFEPLAPPEKRFVDLGDAGRCACFSCCRSIIVDSKDAKPLWNKVIQFFERYLKLPVFAGMADIPILIVPNETMNSQLQNSYHQGATNIMTRGLCLSEHQIGWNVRLPSFSFDRSRGSFESKGHTYFQIPTSSNANPQTRVTAILCLSGLPADLTASILAHEATHAWIKLHPNFDPTKPNPPQVEEGCCQLIAMLFLNDGLDEASSNYDGEGPTDEKLRQYFRFCIETDTSEVYGEGYRKAARAYSRIGIEALLSHVVNYRDFPNI